MATLSLYDVPFLYDRLVGSGACERFYVEEARQAAGAVLECGCGTGRLTIPIARSGSEVMGIDAAPIMLDAARAKAEQAGLDVTLLRGDMRSLALGRRFALILVPCNALAHLTTNDELNACLVGIRRHLAPGGSLVFDIVNPDVRSLAREASEPALLDAHPDSHGQIAVHEVVRYDPVAQVKTAQWHLSAAGQRYRWLAPFRLRQIFPQELPLHLQAAGLCLAARYGSFERTAFTAESPNQICIVRAAR